jgi:hypothetical protein
MASFEVAPNSLEALRAAATCGVVSGRVEKRATLCVLVPVDDGAKALLDGSDDSKKRET